MNLQKTPEVSIDLIDMPSVLTKFSGSRRYNASTSTFPGDSRSSDFVLKSFVFGFLVSVDLLL